MTFMNKFSTNLTKTLAKVAKSSPIEIATCLIYLVICQTNFITNDIKTLQITLFFACFLTIYSLNILCKKSYRAFYYASLALPIATIILAEKAGHMSLESAPIIITLLCSLILALTVKKADNNKEFSVNAAKTIRNSFTSVVLSILSALIIQSIIYSVDAIFDTKIAMATRDILIHLALFGITPAIFLFFEYKESKQIIGQNNFLNVVINFILSPSIIAYGVIMYLYFAKIIITQTMPEGVIFGTAITFMMIGIITKGANLMLDKPKFGWMFKYFSIMAIPAIIMLWISVYERISNYGMTGERVYLIITLSIVTLWCVAMMFKKLYNYKYLTISTITLFITFTYSPIIGYYSVEKAVEQRTHNNVQKYTGGYIYQQNSRTTNLLDISDMNVFREYITSSVENGQMVISDFTYIDQIIYQIDSNDFMNTLLLQAGISRKDTTQLSKATVDEKISQQLGIIHLNDSVIINVTQISTTDSLTLRTFYANWIMMKNN